MSDLITLTQHELQVYTNSSYVGKCAPLFHEEEKQWKQNTEIPTVQISRPQFLRYIRDRVGTVPAKRGHVHQTRPSCPSVTLTVDEYQSLVPKHMRRGTSKVDGKGRPNIMYIPTAEYDGLLKRMAVYRPPPPKKVEEEDNSDYDEEDDHLPPASPPHAPREDWSDIYTD